MKNKAQKGYSYNIDEEKIREYMKLPDEEKLKWLEEALVFTEMFSDEESKRVREAFRKGEI